MPQRCRPSFSLVSPPRGGRCAEWSFVGAATASSARNWSTPRPSVATNASRASCPPDGYPARCAAPERDRLAPGREGSAARRADSGRSWQTTHGTGGELTLHGRLRKPTTEERHVLAPVHAPHHDRGVR